MQVAVTKQFVKQYRRTNDQARVRNVLRNIRNKIEVSQDWLREFKSMSNCAINPTFRTKITEGDRLILNYKPPLTLLDMGKHDETLGRWNKGKTDPTIQVSRSENLDEAPIWLVEIFQDLGLKS